LAFQWIPWRKVKPVFEIGDVFCSTGVPTVTFVDRFADHTKSAEYREIKFKLSNRGLINLFGDSKSGKTVLCYKILEAKNPIILYGQHIKDGDRFWEIVSSELGLAAKKALKTQQKSEDKTKGTIKTSVPGVIAATAAGEIATSQSTEVEEQFSMNSHDAVRVLIRSKRPIIIDDFHSVQKSVQEKIISELKPAIDHGGTIVVISVPEQGEEVFQRLGKASEYRARFTKHEMPLWTPEEIKQIGTKGFEALNVEVPGQILDNLTFNAFRNPLLMQDYCIRLCFELGIERTAARKKKIDVAASIIVKILQDAAAKYLESYSVYYLDTESESLGKWALKSGRSVNINVLVLLSLARIAINKPVGLRTIRQRMRDVLAPEIEPPPEATIRNALVTMAERNVGKEDREAPLRYDTEKRHAYVTHPFFKAFLLWDMVPRFNAAPDTDQVGRVTSAPGS
jgi:hypothetical protein